MKASNFVLLYNTRIKNFNNITNDKIQSVTNDLIKPIKYIPYDDKIKIIDSVLNGNYKTDYPTARIYKEFTSAIISAYTNLEMGKDGYDILCETGLLNYVLNSFKSECEVMTGLLNMCLKDRGE